MMIYYFVGTVPLKLNCRLGRFAFFYILYHLSVIYYKLYDINYDKGTQMYIKLLKSIVG